MSVPLKSTRSAKIFCGTWNMGNAKGEFVNCFIPKNGGDYDIIAIGLQESTYTDEDSVRNITDTEQSIKDLSRDICAILGFSFYLVEHARRAQLQLFIFAKISLKNVISNVEKSAENTGFLHIFPNKGGLLVCFHIDGTKLAFISSHLAAHEGKKKCAARNSSVREILAGVRAGDHKYDVTVQYHHTFFMGDMNYRLDHTTDIEESEKSNSFESKHGKSLGSPGKPVSQYDDSNKDSSDEELEYSHHHPLSKKEFRSKIISLIAEENWSNLMEFDELNRELLAGRVLPGFTAPMPAFPPTFKRVRNKKIELLQDHSNTDMRYNICRLVVAEPEIEPTVGLLSIQSRRFSQSFRIFESQNAENKSHSRRNSGKYDDNDNNNGSNDNKMINKMKSDEKISSKKNSNKSDEINFDDITLNMDYDDQNDNDNNNDNNNNNNKGSNNHSNDSIKKINKKKLNRNLTEDSDETPQIHIFYDKKRIPSYTDRILHKSYPGFKNNLRFLNFKSCEIVPSSDHKPVFCDFLLQTTAGGINIIKNLKNDGIKFELFDLKGSNLAEMDEVMGHLVGSDPYVAVRTDPPQLISEIVKSKVLLHNLNPDWESEVLQLKLNTNDTNGLKENGHICITVWDWDRFNTDDVIGSCEIAMKDIFENLQTKKVQGKPEIYDFDLPIHCDGSMNGRLQGKIRVSTPFQVYNKQFQYDLKLGVTEGSSKLEKNKNNINSGCLCVIT